VFFEFLLELFFESVFFLLEFFFEFVPLFRLSAMKLGW